MKTKKILFVASVAAHIKAFHLPYIEWFQKQGYEVHVASLKDKELPHTIDRFFEIAFVRSPFSIKHFSAYKQLKKVIDAGSYDLIICHTPMASILTRLAAEKARKNGTKLVYVAHGFHFYNGSPKFNWMVYYPIEKYLTSKTDGLVCINNEDFSLINRVGVRSCKYFLVPGVGVDSTRFFKVDLSEKEKIRKKIGFDSEKFNLVYTAEFIPRKNHIFIIEAFNKHKESLKNVHCYFAGNGPLLDDLKQLVQKYKLNDTITFLGFRNDIDEIYKAGDLGISSSLQEGLPINIIEAMSCGLPIVASIARGHNELVIPDYNGFLFGQNDKDAFVNSILKLKNQKDLMTIFSNNALEISKNFSLSNSLVKLTDVYSKFL